MTHTHRIRNMTIAVCLGAAGALSGLAVTPAGAAPVTPTACPSAAVGMLLAHFNSAHLGETAFGAEAIASDPAKWVGDHQALFTGMAGAAAGSCGSGGGY